MFLYSSTVKWDLISFYIHEHCWSLVIVCYISSFTKAKIISFYTLYNIQKLLSKLYVISFRLARVSSQCKCNKTCPISESFLIKSFFSISPSIRVDNKFVMAAMPFLKWFCAFSRGKSLFLVESDRTVAIS